ncbi:Cell number regulator like [Actinidia chinensis var. chinensis]|uniref:Cell number regulator like n=1 Tax=Actinidia chinensis var. chinensis TaxID=1590841 RepID=A0A2R6S0Y2_ACTCC|nr:Cell number regulator like [Actinidia chinensis var. chinensis]
MAEGTYVKLTHEQASLQNITPGELNQPIDVAQLTARKCQECGQSLPPTYQPPADEDWSTGIFGCAEDANSCWTGLFCPYVLFGRNVESVNEDITERAACIGHVICVEGGMTVAALTAAFNGIIDPQTSFLICEGLFFAWWMCGIYTSMARQSLQRKYHLKDSPCDPCMVHCCFHWCALCQEHREIKCRLSNNIAPSTTVVDPPPVQEMNASDQNKEAELSSAKGDGRTGLEIQPV